METLKKQLILLSAVLGIFLVPLFSLSAQNMSIDDFDIYNDNDIIANVYPEIPGPNEEVRIHLNSYVFNLNNYYIAWFLDGRKVSEGFGVRDFRFKMGRPGEVRRVKAVIDVNGRIFKKEYRFAPAEVDLLWQAIDAYTPPFYRGKAIPLYQAKVRVLAIPETKIIAPTDSPNLVYYWKRNKRNIVIGSGFGKNTYTFEADPLRLEETIEVTTNDRRENSFAQSSVTIPFKDNKAEILFYEIDENGRIKTNRALNRFSTVKGDSIHFAFHPLNLSTTEPNFIDLFVGWMVNGKERAPQDFGKQDEMNITTEGQAGDVEVGLHLENIKKLLQTADAKMMLHFTGE